MLLAPLLRRRACLEAHTPSAALQWRALHNTSRRRSKERRTGQRSNNRLVRSKNGSPKDNGHNGDVAQEKSAPSAPSLVEQLFPEEEAKRKRQAQQQQEREVPRLPFEDHVPIQGSEDRQPRQHHGQYHDQDSRMFRFVTTKELREQASEESRPGVLVLHNASKNLVEEDFRRLVPQGKHLGGWTLEQGDILKVVPQRDFATLEPSGFYYLLFSSPLSAFVYQGHVTRIHKMVASQTPSSLFSPIAPPPGYMLDGMDAHGAMKSFTLVSPTDSLQLRQLKPPLSPMMNAVVRHGGLPCLVNRADRMPFEARLTLDGIEISAALLRFRIARHSQRRAQTWSSQDNVYVPSIVKWNPSTASNASFKDPSVFMPSETAAEQEQTEYGSAELDATEESASRVDFGDNERPEFKKRTPPAVYVVGFSTESAMQSFVHHWHRRRLDPDESEGEVLHHGEVGPIVNVDVLW